MRFGVNYTPSRGWFHAWLDPDWGSIKADLQAIAGLGMDHVRIFPLWPLLQPNRTWINDKAIADVRHMAELAGEAGLDVYVDVLQGHLSSFDFLPSWLVTWHETSMFDDGAAVRAQADLVAALYAALADLSCFQGLTLGNECNQFADRSHPRRMSASPESVARWIETLFAPVREEAERRGHVLLHSENDGVWYADGQPFSPVHASNLGSMTTVHSWVFNGTAQHYGSVSEQTVSHAAYLVELAKAFAHDPNRQVWLQEIGAPGNVIDANDVLDFCSRTLDHVLDCDRLFGITWWCSHDVTQDMEDFPPFEHDLGLFDAKGDVKPVGRLYADYAARYCHDACDAAPRTRAIIIPVDERGVPVCRMSCAPGGSVFDLWMEMESRGERPALLSSAIAEDPRMLESLHITECIACEPVAGTAYSAVSDPSLAEAVNGEGTDDERKDGASYLNC